MTDDEFASLMQASGVSDAATGQAFYAPQPGAAFTTDPFFTPSRETYQDMWTMPPMGSFIDPFAGFMPFDSPVAEPSLLPANVMQSPAPGAQGIVSEILTALHRVEATLQDISARQDVLESTATGLDDKLNKLKEGLGSFSSTSVDLLHDIHFQVHQYQSGQSSQSSEEEAESIDDGEVDDYASLDDYASVVDWDGAFDKEEYVEDEQFDDAHSV
ncbi:hypothetical protein JX265_014034 [Neoarthrinium moseri]|uniref:Uncharacterized protein n=1 Tax=Neoarthrinium moseri TaxID=1658444 RepID=A0A9P9W7E8_9PEZI|nr:hypothetical protein JX265_014110 [Neoarthrinium moseri]KAI1846584.1 hypothetical protein JX265_014034 [Neoarthrinium moseri]